MRFAALSLGLLSLCTSACTFLDDLDRSIEEKASALTQQAKPAPEPEPAPATERTYAPGDPLAPDAPAPQPPPPPAAPASPEPASPLGPSELTIGKPAVHGKLPEKAATFIMDRHRNELSFCYEQSLTDTATTTLLVKFVVSPRGAVQVATIEQSNSGNERFDMCIAQAIKRWTFPSPMGGGIAIVTVPIELSRAAAAKP